MEKLRILRVKLDMEIAKKIKFIAAKEGKSTAQYLSDLIKAKLKDIK